MLLAGALWAYDAPEPLMWITTWGGAILVVAGVLGAVAAGLRVVNARWDKRIERVSNARDEALAAKMEAALAAAIKKVDERFEELGTRVDTRTRPIQPESNGGKALPDAIDRLEGLEGRFDRLEAAVRSLITDGEQRRAGAVLTREDDAPSVTPPQD